MLRLSIETLTGPMRSRNARTGWTRRTSLLLRLIDGEREGRGECAPLPNYSRETLSQCRSWLEAFPLSCTAELEASFLKPGVPAAAAFGLQSALLEMRGPTAPHSLAPLPVATLDAEAPAASLKVKIGPSTILDNLPDTRPVRLDANQTLTASMAAEVLPRLHSLNVEFVEEPVPFEELQALNRQTSERPPIALDESLQGSAGPERLRRALGEGWAEIVVLKPMALGPDTTASLLDIAQAHAAPVVVSHLLAGPVAFAATCRLAFSAGSSLPQGLGRHPGLTSFAGWSTTLGDQGMIRPWTSAQWPVLAPHPNPQ